MWQNCYFINVSWGIYCNCVMFCWPVGPPGTVGHPGPEGPKGQKGSAGNLYYNLIYIIKKNLTAQIIPLYSITLLILVYLEKNLKHFTVFCRRAWRRGGTRTQGPRRVTRAAGRDRSCRLWRKGWKRSDFTCITNLGSFLNLHYFCTFSPLTLRV